MSELEFVKLLIQYGPIGLIGWFLYRDWKRELRSIEREDRQNAELIDNEKEHSKTLEKVATEAVSAIRSMNETMREMRVEIKSSCRWNGNERRQHSSGGE